MRVRTFPVISEPDVRFPINIWFRTFLLQTFHLRIKHSVPGHFGLFRSFLFRFSQFSFPDRTFLISGFISSFPSFISAEPIFVSKSRIFISVFLSYRRFRPLLRSFPIKLAPDLLVPDYDCVIYVNSRSRLRLFPITEVRSRFFFEKFFLFFTLFHYIALHFIAHFSTHLHSGTFALFITSILGVF